jgi:hypothetical protein
MAGGWSGWPSCSTPSASRKSPSLRLLDAANASHAICHHPPSDSTTHPHRPFSFLNFGPNTTTYLLPSKLFPKEVKSTLNGLAAATGKLGTHPTPPRKGPSCTPHKIDGQLSVTRRAWRGVISGGFIGSSLFAPMLDRWGLGPVLGICGGVAVVGAIVTVIFIDTPGADSRMSVVEHDYGDGSRVTGASRASTRASTAAVLR